MNIKITHRWLLDHLETKANPEKIAEALSLCGPAVEKIEKKGKDWVYEIEVTTNRVDAMSVVGIAREAAAILPRFGIKAKLKPLKLAGGRKVNKYPDFVIKNHPKLTRRLMGVVIEDIKNWKTPGWMKERLMASGIRSLNAVVDITNYVMMEVGHPTHVFDFDKVVGGGFVIREARKGEKVVSLEGKEYVLAGGDIVIARENGEIIDLPGVIGTKNSIVSAKTKRVLFFLENNDKVRIRKTSMTLGIRTMAATLNEKGVDPYLGEVAIARGLELFGEVCGSKKIREIIDIFPVKPRRKSVSAKKEFIEARLGIELAKGEITKILNNLEMKTKWVGSTLTVWPPSFRASDIRIAEDVVEEVARIYGYHNLPSQLMAGELPAKALGRPFAFELKAKQILKETGGHEVYTESLVEKEVAGKGALALANPLGKEGGYLRTSLRPSLLKVAQKNGAFAEKGHVFEMANVYWPEKNDLPMERHMLAGIFWGEDWREAKGVIEVLLEKLGIVYGVQISDKAGCEINKAIEIKAKGKRIGELGQIAVEDVIYYEFGVEGLRENYMPIRRFKPIPKYPAQIEDITFLLPEKTLVNELVKSMTAIKRVERVELVTIYKKAHTFRVWYLDPKKTLNNKEVERVRKRIIERVKNKFGGVLKG